MRNKSLNTTLIYTVWGVAVTSMLIPLKPIVPIVSAGIWVLWTWVLAIESMWIGRKQDEIMEILSENGLNVSWEEAYTESGIK